VRRICRKVTRHAQTRRVAHRRRRWRAGVDRAGGRSTRPPIRQVYVSPSGKDLGQITELVEAGALRVLLDQVLPLEQAAKAHELSETNRVSGKIVLATLTKD
jgi:NADPH:quinone reductase-like Zn-dependent oxidoreductase